MTAEQTKTKKKEEPKYVPPDKAKVVIIPDSQKSSLSKPPDVVMPTAGAGNN